MKLKFIALTAIAACCMASCDDTTDIIGNTLTDNQDILHVSTDSFVVSTRSLIADSVLARTNTGYLGRMKDVETGSYVTGDYMVQFSTLEDYSFPNADSIVGRYNGLPAVDSVEIRLYHSTHEGDSLAPMRLTAYEMTRPMSEGTNYYSNFDPVANGYVDTENAFQATKTYAIEDANVSDDDRNAATYTPSIRIVLDKPYTKDGTTWNNYGTYILQTYYAHPEYFKNVYNFVHHVVPGFYVRHEGGQGAMAGINISQLNLFFTYQAYEPDSGRVMTFTGTTSFAGTEEALQTNRITNDVASIRRLAADNSCTYIKSPAGIFTEITLPVDEIMAGHERDTLNTAKLTLTRLNNLVHSSYASGIPKTLLILPKDSMYTFFEQGKVFDNRTSFVATYSSTTNGYTFSNLSGLVTYMYHHRNGADWNKAVVIPVKYDTGSTGVVTKVYHDMSLGSTRLVGGSENAVAPIRISCIYSRFNSN